MGWRMGSAWRMGFWVDRWAELKMLMGWSWGWAGLEDGLG